MERESDYLALQQPGVGYETPGAVSGAANYGTQQSPASAYTVQQSQGSGGGGSGAAQAAKAKLYDLPSPDTVWSGNKFRVPRVSTLPLYEKRKAPHSYDEILQQNVGDCYLAAALAAMANTNAGRSQIASAITPHNGAITTICKEYDSDGQGGPEQRLKSNHWFTVAFKQENVDVSDVLYHDDSDRNPNLRYLTTPNGDRALWGAIVEVAYAKLKGGYDKIGASSVSVNKFVDEFLAVKWAILAPVTDKAAIRKACQSAGKRAAFIATKVETEKLSFFHGYAVLGMNGEKVKLWDPLKGTVVEIEFKDLLTEVQAVIGS